ncbi:MAG: hypothetical protein R6U67_05085 [Sodalinema sp.]|uniref:hypothetical protein n=1 Tax=Sodalinema sp. TaxID=3080550 RepID=UPI001206A6C6|nr:MAG: hypothetical protein EYR95_10535 [Phormidium sp. SL48-SHIP]
MKYFFLSEGWTVARVWGTQGLWNVNAWRRPPDIERLDLCLVERGERLWLYRVEAAVLMVEVRPQTLDTKDTSISHVMLKRLMDAEQVLTRLCTSSVTCQLDLPKN